MSHSSLASAPSGIQLSAEGEAVATNARKALADIRVADVITDGLIQLGVRYVFGMTGGAIAPLAAAMNESEMSLLHFRHESGAAFAALEASLATGRPTAVFTTTGPGLTNALTGLTAARWEGAKVILLSATTSPGQRGRWAFQETSSYATPFAGLYLPSQLFHFAVSMSAADELPNVFARLAVGCAQDRGFIANIGLPIRLQSAPAKPLRVRPVPKNAPGLSAAAAKLHAGILNRERVAIWVGFGARGAAKQVRALAERMGAAVLCTPRGKGIFPEDHPQFVGVTGMGGHESAAEYMQEERPSRVLVLGTRMGEFSSLWDERLVPPAGFIHVDVDPEVHGAAFPEAPLLPVTGDIGSYLDAVLPLIEPRKVSRGLVPLAAPKRPEPRANGVSGMDTPVRPQALLAAMQDVIVENSDAIIMTEAGNAFAWGTHALRFQEPRYRVSVGFGSMGHAAAGVVGLALSSGKKAVALLGDGALLMTNEINTAVCYGTAAVWIVLNDGLYGMVDQGMRRHGLGPVETVIPRADFVEIARGMGADGVRVEHESQLHAALEQAMAAKVPFVVDVMIDPREAAPIKSRVQALMEQERGDS